MQVLSHWEQDSSETNPFGLIIGIEGELLQQFITALGNEIKQIAPGTMLHPGIAKTYAEKKATALSQQEVVTVAESATAPAANQGVPVIASASGKAFLNNPVLHQEVFGPYSLVIRCADIQEMLQVALHLEGQLTCTLMATEQDVLEQEELIGAIQNICGRYIMNSDLPGWKYA